MAPPNEKIKSVCYIKNVITCPNIVIGDYTYYDDISGAERFEEHVTHYYECLGDTKGMPGSMVIRITATRHVECMILM